MDVEIPLSLSEWDRLRELVAALEAWAEDDSVPVYKDGRAVLAPPLFLDAPAAIREMGRIVRGENE